MTACGCQPCVLSAHSLTVDTEDVEMTALNHPQQSLVGRRGGGVRDRVRGR